jgi:hypothetical protein
MQTQPVNSSGSLPMQPTAYPVAAIASASPISPAALPATLEQPAGPGYRVGTHVLAAWKRRKLFYPAIVVERSYVGKRNGSQLPTLSDVRYTLRYSDGMLEMSVLHRDTKAVVSAYVEWHDGDFQDAATMASLESNTSLQADALFRLPSAATSSSFFGSSDDPDDPLSLKHLATDALTTVGRAEGQSFAHSNISSHIPSPSDGLAGGLSGMLDKWTDRVVGAQDQAVEDAGGDIHTRAYMHQVNAQRQADLKNSMHELAEPAAEGLKWIWEKTIGELW